jgi:hypothetical protein
VLFFALTVALALSAVPVMVMIVLRTGARAAHPAAARSVEKVIVWLIWGLMGLGLAVALPAAIRGGRSDTTGAPDAAARTISARPSHSASGRIGPTSIAMPSPLPARAR